MSSATIPAFYYPGGALWLGNCLELMQHVPDGSVDMILCDLPYGTTACKWDTIIPFAPLWAHYWRVLKPNGAIVLTAAQPFTTQLIASQIERFKYCWVWEKEKGTNFGNCKKQPLRNVEDIAIFYRLQCVYNPQMTPGKPYVKNRKMSINDGQSVYNNGALGENITVSNGERYPQQVLRFGREKSKYPHPTQKPVALFEYLIKTYTNPGDLVMDNCAGSGTTGVAAHNTGRRWLLIEQDVEYYLKAGQRLNERVLHNANL